LLLLLVLRPSVRYSEEADRHPVWPTLNDDVWVVVIEIRDLAASPAYVCLPRILLTSYLYFRVELTSSNIAHASLSASRGRGLGDPCEVLLANED
jgi:hypothetical protein